MKKAKNKTDERKAGVERVERFLGSQVKDNSVVEMLADIRHWCDANGVDFQVVEKASCQTYLHERKKVSGNDVGLKGKRR